MEKETVDTFVITLDDNAIATLISGSQLKVKLGSGSKEVKVIIKPAPYFQ